MTGDEQKIEELRVCFLSVFAAAGFDLVHMELYSQGSTAVVKILADRPLGGIMLEDCARLNRQLCALLEETMVLGEDFSVEVSSPGMDWPLQTWKDFLRAQDRLVQVFLNEPVAGKWEQTGCLARVNEDMIALARPLSRRQRDEGVSPEIEIPLGKVKKAIQIV